jgi:hypothetical protein
MLQTILIQRLMVCLYLKRLDTIGTSAHIPMVTNFILQRTHATGYDTKSDRRNPTNVWSQVDLNAIPNSIYVHKRKTLSDNARSLITVTIFSTGLAGTKLSVTSMASKRATGTILTRRAFELALVKINRLLH